MPPAIKPLEAWSAANQRFYQDFLQWLREGGYGDSTVYLYSRAARLALGWLDKDYRLVDPQADLESVRRAIATHYDSEATCQTYFKGLAKLAEYLRFRCVMGHCRQADQLGLLPRPASCLAGCRRTGLPHPSTEELVARGAIPGNLHPPQPSHPFVALDNRSCPPG